MSHTPGAVFQTRLLDNQRGCQYHTERYVFGKLSLGEMFSTPTFFGTGTTPTAVEISTTRNRPRGVRYTWSYTAVHRELRSLPVEKASVPRLTTVPSRQQNISLPSLPVKEIYPAADYHPFPPRKHFLAVPSHQDVDLLPRLRYIPSLPVSNAFRGRPVRSRQKNKVRRILF